MIGFLDRGREASRQRLREGLALLGSLGVTAIALFALPAFATAIFVRMWPALAASIGGWVTIGALIVAALGFPVVHASAHTVLVGELPPWLASPRRWGRLALFAVWTGVPLALVLADPFTHDPGIYSMVWGAGVLAVPLLERLRTARIPT